jgi:hypothetical protein
MNDDCDKATFNSLEYSAKFAISSLFGAIIGAALILCVAVIVPRPSSNRELYYNNNNQQNVEQRLNDLLHNLQVNVEHFELIDNSKGWRLLVNDERHLHDG